MTAVQAIKRRLSMVLKAQSRCVSEEGYVLPCYRYRYQMLVKEARLCKEGLEFLGRLSKNS